MPERETEEQRDGRLALWSWQDRQLHASRPPRLDDGRRLIRVFPEWFVELPLWENFSDAYPATRETFPLSDDLLDALTAWNDEWQDRQPEDPLSDEERWIADGLALVHRLRTELAGVAEIRAEFGH